ncbi:MAG TPA: ATP-dependent endonuclease, partial [Candidatus Atribacteria bacterium]|nr:ATP-dependent endonuclease [Candidatus Atribacteria bacterium]
GPSPLRNTLTFVMKKVVKTSESFKSLNEAFEEFNKKFKEEASKDGISLENFRKEINENLKEWEVEFNIAINPVRPEDIIKNLVSHSFIDKILDKKMDIGLYGQGLQRHLIYVLIRLSSKYKEEKIYEKKEFSPELTLILFEEPEAFLHPTQQEYLDFSLRSLASEEGLQVIVSTHSPIFVSRNIEDISFLIKLKRENGVTRCFQVSEEIREDILKENNEFTQLLKEKLDDLSVDERTKKRIRNILGDTDDDKRMDEEGIRYSLWLDSERSSSFFADIVLICEGATEKTFIDYLLKNEWDDFREKKIYVLDAMGKFNIHRYMNLFKALGIYHSVLADRDENNNVHEIINEFIESNQNEYKKKIYFFNKNIEDFLGIPIPTIERKDKKPLNVMWHYKNNKIEKTKINQLKDIIEGLV